MQQYKNKKLNPGTRRNSPTGFCLESLCLSSFQCRWRGKSSILRAQISIFYFRYQVRVSTLGKRHKPLWCNRKEKYTLRAVKFRRSWLFVSTMQWVTLETFSRMSSCWPSKGGHLLLPTPAERADSLSPSLLMGTTQPGLCVLFLWQGNKIR